jgi:hypothetical protein
MFYSFNETPLCLFLVFGRAHLGKLEGGEQRSTPGAKVF